MAEILDLIVPYGWFLPVVPGTKFVTVGGAIANDIHGKNHHRAASFGCHVRSFELLRSDGQRLLCSLSENPEWFRATIGGLGLTGVILWAAMDLKRIHNSAVDVETIRFAGLDEFFSFLKNRIVISNTPWRGSTAWPGQPISAEASLSGETTLMPGQPNQERQSIGYPSLRNCRCLSSTG